MERKYVLVAERRSDLRWMYEHWLSESGHIVRTVPDGPWLLSLAPPSPPDLIILDMEVEGVDALGLTRLDRRYLKTIIEYAKAHPEIFSAVSLPKR